MTTPEAGFLATKSEAVNRRSYLINPNGISTESVNLMDQIAGLVSESDIEPAYNRIVQVQNSGNETYGTKVSVDKGLRITALIDVAKEKGLITEEEHKKLRLTVDGR